MKPTLEQVQEWRAMAYRYADKQTGDYNEADEIAQEKFAELAAQWGAERAQHEAKNAPWLTTAHVICTDAGITHGPISERLEALRDKLADKAQQTTEETDAEMALRSIASWLGVGGFNAPTVDAKAFEQKIYEGVEIAIKSHYVAAEEPALPDAVAYTHQGEIEYVEAGGHAGSFYGAKNNPDLKDAPDFVGLYTDTQTHDHYQAGVRAGAARSQDAKRYRWLRSRSPVDCCDQCGYDGIALRTGKLLDVHIDEAMQGDSQ